jgi:hypothetical protein
MTSRRIALFATAAVTSLFASVARADEGDDAAKSCNEACASSAAQCRAQCGTPPAIACDDKASATIPGCRCLNRCGKKQGSCEKPCAKLAQAKRREREDRAKRADEATATADKDGDGIPDSNDDCPAVRGTAAKKGCPEKSAQAPKTWTCDELYSKDEGKAADPTFAQFCSARGFPHCTVFRMADIRNPPGTLVRAMGVYAPPGCEAKDDRANTPYRLFLHGRVIGEEGSLLGFCCP